jgi:hypothetical protein
MEISLPLSFCVVERERKREKRSREERKIGWLVEKGWVIGGWAHRIEKKSDSQSRNFSFFFISCPTCD